MEWEKLELLPDKPNIRHCRTCDKNVHLTSDEFTLALSISFKFCVAVPIELVQQMPELDAHITEFNSRDPKTRSHLLGAAALPASKANNK